MILFVDSGGLSGKNQRNVSRMLLHDTGHLGTEIPLRYHRKITRTGGRFKNTNELLNLRAPQ